MNKVILMGNLTRDPEIRYGGQDNQKAIGRFTIAVNRKVGNEVDFFNCTCFDKKAEFAEKYLHKGSKVLIAGRIQLEAYTNREGQKVTGVQVYPEDIEFAEKKEQAVPGLDDNPFLT